MRALSLLHTPHTIPCACVHTGTDMHAMFRYRLIVLKCYCAQPAKKSSKYDYDMSHLGEMFQSYAMGLCMMALLHVQV